MSNSGSKGLFVKPGLTIPDSELSERFVHASGPGGQNVNKVASAVQLSFDVLHSPSLPDPVRVKVARQSDGAELFQGQMERSERRDFPNVPLWVTATALESVRLEFKGKQFMIQAKGYNRVPVDANQFSH